MKHADVAHILTALNCTSEDGVSGIEWCDGAGKTTRINLWKDPSLFLNEEHIKCLPSSDVS